MFKKRLTDTLIGTSGQLKRKNELFKINKKMMMLLHEYQAQGLLKKYSVPIPMVIIYLKKLGGSYTRSKWNR